MTHVKEEKIKHVSVLLDSISVVINSGVHVLDYGNNDTQLLRVSCLSVIEADLTQISF